MFDHRVRLFDRNLAQLLGSYVRLGNAFLFFACDSSDREWTGWLAQKLPNQPTQGPLVVSLLAPGRLPVPGGTIDPIRLPRLRLDGITSDKSIYRSGRDTVHLLVFALDRAEEELSLVVYANGQKSSEVPIRLDGHGVGLLPLRDLPAGTYEVCFAHVSPYEEAACTFTVAEYRLAPLVATLTQRSWDEQANRLDVTLRLETFGVAVSGGVRVTLMDRDERVAEVLATADDGLLEVALPLKGPGPHSINLQLQADPARTASIPLLGSRAGERSSTLFSTIGARVSGSLLPADGARPVRGLYLSESAEQSSIFRLERVDATRARLTATAAARAVCLVVVNLLKHDQVQSVSRAAVAAGETIELDVPGPAALLMAGAFVDGIPWEGWAAMLHPDRLNPRLIVPKTCAPDGDVTIAVETEGQTQEGVAYLVVKDARLLSPQTPSNRLAGRIKSAVANFSAWTANTPAKVLQGSAYCGAIDVGDELVRRDVIGVEQLQEARDLMRRTGVHPHYALVRLGYTTWERIARVLADVYQWPFVNLNSIDIPPAIIELMPESVARENLVLPLACAGGRLTIVLEDPTDFDTIQKLQFILNKEIAPAVAPCEQIIEAINRHYGQTETESVDSMLAEFTDTAIDFTETGRVFRIQRRGAFRRAETSIDLDNAIDLSDEPGSEPTDTPTTRDEPEVVFAGLLPLRQGKASATVHLGPGFTDYLVEVFVVSGLDWSSAEADFRAEKDPFISLDLPMFVHRDDCVMGRIHAGARSRSMRVTVTRDSVEVPLEYAGRTLQPGEVLHADRATLLLIAQPGEYRATIEDGSGGSDVSMARIEEPGKLRTTARSLRFLEPGQSLTAGDPSILSLRVLAGLHRPLDNLVSATADYAHHCCEQTAAKILAGCAMYALAQENTPRRAQAEAIIRAGIERESLMWLPGRGFKMYPHLSDEPHPGLGPLAARYLRNLVLLRQNKAGLMSPGLRAALDQGLRMAEDAFAAYRLDWPPARVASCVEGWSVLVFNPDAEARARAADFVRGFVAGQSGSGAVRQRGDSAYAAAALFLTGDREDRRRAWPLVNSVLQDLGPEGRLYSTLDSVAAIALMRELSTLAETGTVEVNGRPFPTDQAALLPDAVHTLTARAGVTIVELTRLVEEDWDRLNATVPLQVTLETQGQARSQFTVGDAIDLHVRVPSGYVDGDLLWVCLPDALSWVMGGGQLKRFAVDLAGANEVRVPLAATGWTTDRTGRPLHAAGLKAESSDRGGVRHAEQPCGDAAGNTEPGAAGNTYQAPQRLAVCLRNMFDEERAGNPGPIRVAILRGK
jgi:hypothetical protein